MRIRHTFDLLTPSRVLVIELFTRFRPMRWISVNFTDMSHEGMRSQTFDLLTPQPFGRDRIFDDVFSDEIVSSELCGHVRKCEARCSTC